MSPRRSPGDVRGTRGGHAWGGHTLLFWVVEESPPRGRLSLGGVPREYLERGGHLVSHPRLGRPESRAAHRLGAQVVEAVLVGARGVEVERVGFERVERRVADLELDRAARLAAALAKRRLEIRPLGVSIQQWERSEFAFDPSLERRRSRRPAVRHGAPHRGERPAEEAAHAVRGGHALAASFFLVGARGVIEGTTERHAGLLGCRRRRPSA
mmetsp:Transcript_14551/g.58101  ORF Transcript_14551/g.58101 Transcript_14551/m.58101 type:complete len:212 (-) Transcript_14551:151-786(-)